MAGDIFRKPVAGEPLSIPAELYGRLVDLVQGGDFRLRGSQQPTFRQTGIVKVRNNLGEDLERFAVVGLNTPIIDPDDLLEQFQSRPTFRAETPTESHAGKFGILLEPIPDGETGEAVISGVVQAQVNINSASDRFAEVGDSTEYLESASFGSAQILWRNGPSSQTGVQWATVRLCNGEIATAGPSDTRYTYYCTNGTLYKTKTVAGVTTLVSATPYCCESDGVAGGCGASGLPSPPSAICIAVGFAIGGKETSETCLGIGGDIEASQTLNYDGVVNGCQQWSNATSIITLCNGAWSVNLDFGNGFILSGIDIPGTGDPCAFLGSISLTNPNIGGVTFTGTITPCSPASPLAACCSAIGGSPLPNLTSTVTSKVGCFTGLPSTILWTSEADPNNAGKYRWKTSTSGLAGCSGSFPWIAWIDNCSHSLGYPQLNWYFDGSKAPGAPDVNGVTIVEGGNTCSPVSMVFNVADNVNSSPGTSPPHSATITLAQV